MHKRRITLSLKRVLAIPRFTAVGVKLSLCTLQLANEIKQIGIHASGLPLYGFKYIWDTSTTHIGFMADEVRKVFPHAVHVHSSGYDMVDYGAIT